MQLFWENSLQLKVVKSHFIIHYSHYSITPSTPQFPRNPQNSVPLVPLVPLIRLGFPVSLAHTRHPHPPPSTLILYLFDQLPSFQKKLKSQKYFRLWELQRTNLEGDLLKHLLSHVYVVAQSYHCKNDSSESNNVFDVYLKFEVF